MRPLQDLAIADVLDIHPLHPHQFLMTPFLPSGFSVGDLYVNYDSARGTCRNCRGSGVNFEAVPAAVIQGLDQGFFELKEVVDAASAYGVCTYCDGAGHVSLPAPYAMTGRVLIPHEICNVWCGDVIVFEAGAYDIVKMNDGREFAVMHDQSVLAIIEDFDKPVAPEGEKKEIVLV